MDLDIATATATQLAQALRDRQISSRELLDYLLARAEKLNPALNAIVAWDADRAGAAARAADEATARGEAAGPLHGLPMTVKDTFETEGLVTTAGAAELARHVPRTDAVAVARLRAAGAIIMGKSNTPLYAGDIQTYNDVYGRTNNPWDTSRTAGGSSGGAAAAVAAGLTPLELGSDIGGSIRNPAHYNGVYGHKPSWGIVPLRGHIPGPPGSLVEVDVGVAGPIARSVADLRTALSAIAGPLPQDAAGWRLDLDPGADLDDVAGLRVATVFGEGADVLPVARDVRANLDRFADRLADAGARMEAAALPVPLADGFRSWRDLVLPILGLGLPEAEYNEMKGLEDRPGNDIGLVTAQAMTSRFRSWMDAAGLRERQRAAWAGFFERYDVVLAPVMPTAAYPHDTAGSMPERRLDVDGTSVPHTVTIAWCGAIGAMLLPVVTLPAGLNQAGLPVGVQVIGPFLADLRLLRMAEMLAAAAGAGFTPPALLLFDFNYSNATIGGVRPRKLRSPLALVVLGLLAEEPLHPYAMRQRIKERAHDRIPGVRLASLYDAVQRMAEAGLVSADDPSREGRRPERVRYVITEAGREALLGWVTQGLADPADHGEFPAALSFMYALGRDRAVELLQARAAALGRSTEIDEAAVAQAESGGVPPIFLSEHRYQLALRRAEQTWLTSFTEALRTGALGWPAPTEGTPR